MKKWGKRPGLLAFSVLGVYVLMFMVISFGGISENALKVVERMPGEISSLLVMLVAFAVKDATDGGDDK